MYWKSFVLASIVCLHGQLVLAQENKPIEVVVTANRFEQPAREVAASMSVVTAEDIKNSGQSEVQEVLRTVPGVDVARNGGLGGSTAVFLRGANSEHTLILVDGIELNDPINPTRAFNFSDLTTDNIERIEVVRGPQSTIYGSDALGGVINIITKKGTGSPSGFASIEAGSFRTMIERAGSSGSFDKFNYSVGISRTDTAGISANSSGSEDDYYKNSSFSGRFGYEVNENLELNFYSRYNEAHFQLDDGVGPGGDDPNRLASNKTGVLRAEADLHFFDKRFHQKLGVSLSTHNFEDNNDPDEVHVNEVLRSKFDSRLVKIDLQNELKWVDWNTLVFGVETEQEKGSSEFFSDGDFGPFSSNFDERTARTNGYYLQDETKLWKSFFLAAGVRLDDRSKFGSKTTWRGAPAYLIESTGTKFRASYGTGYKAPSLFQLYSDFGNPDLNAEESRGWDAGFDQTITEKTVGVGASYFHNDFENLITFNPQTFVSENIGDARTRGVEAYAWYKPLDDLKFELSYTHLNTKDKNTGAQLLRRAKNRITVSANYKPIEALNLNANMQYVGKRNDNDFSTFPASTVTLDGYTLVNLAASYQLNERVEIFARIDNLFDKQYEDVLGFGTPGLAGYAGIRVTF